MQTQIFTKFLLQQTWFREQNISEHFNLEHKELPWFQSLKPFFPIIAICIRYQKTAIYQEMAKEIGFTLLKGIDFVITM